MDDNRNYENERAERIALSINDKHIVLADIYENLVDRDFDEAKKDVQNLISDLNLILKSIEHDFI
jgi:hypothetical protein